MKRNEESNISKGMPNDFMQNFDPISILIFTPFLDRILYPILRRMGIELRPIARELWRTAFIDDRSIHSPHASELYCAGCFSGCCCCSPFCSTGKSLSRSYIFSSMLS